MRTEKDRKNYMDLVTAFCLFMGTSPINLAFLDGNGIKIRRQNNIDRHCVNPIPNECQLPNPPPVALQTTFNGVFFTYQLAQTQCTIIRIFSCSGDGSESFLCLYNDFFFSAAVSVTVRIPPFRPR